MGVSPDFSSTKLFISDFDNTYALTNECSPNNVTVELAYERAIGTLFGRTGLFKYQHAGGLKNRGPSEVVAQLAPMGADRLVHLELAEELVQLKLGHLLQEIGQRLPDGEFWPRLSPGFEKVWKRIAECEMVDSAVVTSGHLSFVKRFHDIHDLPMPEFIVTDDNMRPLMAHLPREMCVKPASLLVEIVHRQWLSKYFNGAAIGDLSQSKQQLLYAGDDPTKDGQMAVNYGVRFALIDSASYEASWQSVSDTIFNRND